jgi:hypothetical protein
LEASNSLVLGGGARLVSSLEASGSSNETGPV